MRPAGLLRRLYRLCLRAYPEPDRRRCAREMEELLADLHLDVRGRKGRVAASWLFLRACLDVLIRGMRRRFARGRGHSARARDGRRPVRNPLGNLVQDGRYALRTFAATPAVTTVAIVVFALGIGATTGVFSVVEAVLLRSLPYASSERLVDITLRPARSFDQGKAGAGGGTVDLATYRAWRARVTVLEDMAVYTSREQVLTGLGEPEKVGAYAVESTLFPMLGAAPLLGRGFLPEEDVPGAGEIVVVSHGFWTSRLGADPDVLGRTLTLGGRPYEVVGVMPRGFRFPTFADPDRTVMWIPFGLHAEDHAQGGCWIAARLRPGVSPLGAKAELDGIAEDIDLEGARAEGREGWLASVTPLGEWVSEDVRQPLLVLLGAVGLVLLVACSNVANLLLARGAGRAREMSIRMAVGASAPRLLGQVLVESVLLAAAGAALGVLLALQAVPAILAAAGDLVPRVNDVGVNGAVLAAALAGTLVAGVAAGCVPALQAARRARRGSIGTEGRVNGGRQVSRGTSLLVVAQLALTLVLLTGAGLLLRSLAGLLAVEPGFEASHILIAEIELPGWLYPEDEQRLAYTNEVYRRVAATSGMEEVAVSNFAPFEGGLVSSVGVPDAPDLEQLPWAYVVATTAGYFRLVGLPLLRGNLYDATTTDNVAVIDQAAADAYFGGADPIGRQLATYRWRDRPLTVIGIVGNVREDSLRSAPPPHVYVHISASPDPWLRVLARGEGRPAALASSLRAAIRGVDPFVPVERIAPASALIAESVRRERFYSLLLGSFAAAAILMAAAGVFGVMRYSVSRRTRELGIRVALGAGNGNLVGMFVRRGLALAALGIVLGLFGAAVVTSLLSSFLYGVSPLDPLTFAAAAIAIVGLALAATTLPAWRATQVDPVRSLRAE